MATKTQQYNYAIFDCETGGIDRVGGFTATTYAITEIAFQIINDKGELLDQYQSYIKPITPFEQLTDDTTPEQVKAYGDLNYTKDALTFTQITIGTLYERGQDYKKVASDIQALLTKHIIRKGRIKMKPILVGHNVVFDIPLLKMLFQQAQIGLNDCIDGYYDDYNEFTPSFVDTLNYARLIPDLSDNKLETFAAYCGVDLIDAHQAMNDVEATRQVFTIMQQRLNNSSVQGVQQQKYERDFKFQLPKF